MAVIKDALIPPLGSHIFNRMELSIQQCQTLVIRNTDTTKRCLFTQTLVIEDPNIKWTKNISKKNIQQR